MRQLLRGVGLVVILMGLVACSSNRTLESHMGVDGAPDWVNEGTQAVDDDDGRYIQGVGFASPLNDEALQRSAADNRARAELAKVISTYVDSTLSDYAASSGDSATSSIEQNINSTTQTVLNGAKIKARWKDSKTGNLYSFAEMDMKVLDDAILAAGKLSQNFKDFYTKNSTANFERFIKEGK